MEQYAKRHTPGPWKIEQELIDDPRLDIADITAPVPGTQHKTEVARVYCENRKGATVGPNARLIAKSPDLLQAVKEAIDTASWLQYLIPQIRPYIGERHWSDRSGNADKAMESIAKFLAIAEALVAEIEGGA